MVKFATKFDEAVFQISQRHLLWPEVNVEERAPLPCFFVENPALLTQPVVKRCSRERRHESDLDIEQPAFTNKLINTIKRLWTGPIQAHNKTTIDSDTMPLNRLDCL